MRSDLPAGTVTFVFTDVEGSTKLLNELGAENYAAALAEHRRALRAAFSAHGGVEVDTQGDAFFVAFPTAPGALRAAEQALEALAAGPIRVRVGLHTGTPHLAEEGYVGEDVHRAARIAAAGHGGQVLVSAATASLVDSDGLRDLGEHRFKDLSAPERVYQLGEGDFPPLKSLHQTNLPVPTTPFLGRECELGEVIDLLRRDDVRLLTLTGPGGTGKTRLALQAAAEAAERFSGGVFWVPLAPLRDPALVLQQAASALGAKDALAEYIADKSLLLYLDNFEHVIPAAEELPALLSVCPNLRLLVTSRELLRLPGEQAYPVPPLQPQEGEEFFLARARAADPGFQPTDAVPALCVRLEQLPLALELAAARVRMLSPEQLLQRLAGRLDLLKAGRGADQRQQTLRATIEWSYELLDDEEQRLFACLGVFAGGCTIDAAEQVTDADLDVLQSLVDKSLLRVRGGERFWMLETIREYAAEQLQASSEADELRRRHAEHFLALAEEAEPHLFGVSAGRWHDRLERELDNIRVALDWLEACGETEHALRMAGALAEFWAVKGHLAEGRRRLETALAADERPTAARAKALNGAADLANGTGELGTARLRAEEGLALNRTLGRAWGTADSLLLLGIASNNEEDFATARKVIDEGVRLFRELGDERNALEATRSLAWAYRGLGDLDNGRALMEDTVRRARSLGDKQIEARSMEMLGGYAVEEGRIADGLRLLKEAYRLNRELGDAYSTPTIVCRFGRALAAVGQAAPAARVLSSGQSLLAEMGATAPWIATSNEETLTVIHALLDDAAFAEAWEQGRSLTADEAVALALNSLD